jgi:hypothetical protein
VFDHIASSSRSASATSRVRPFALAALLIVLARASPVASRKIALPLCSNVLTSVKPMPVNMSRRSAIAIRLFRPTLMPRNNAMWVVPAMV